jgi:MFS family permease
MPIFAKAVLDQGASAYTNLMSAAGIGSFIAAITMAAIARFGIRKRLYLFAAVVTACLQVSMMFVHDYSLALVVVAVMGFLNMSFMNLGNVIFQVNTLNEYRGRVMSVYAFLTQGSTPIGNLYAGTAMDLFGGGAGFPACGAAALLFLVPVFVIKRKTLASWVTERHSKNP